MIVLGTDLGSALFRAKLAIAKQAERAWHASELTWSAL